MFFLVANIIIVNYNKFYAKDNLWIIKKIVFVKVMASPSPSGGPELLAFLNTMEAFNQTHGMGGNNEDFLLTIARVS